ncbi:hypothetical protein AB5J62_24515 [Amycolatopsis sp. cg5]|uniref:hypothetical protein n=1 Tax=Amycolatopsis sp. cg5 TaxID=3238802 RepID=UPI003523DA14
MPGDSVPRPVAAATQARGDATPLRPDVPSPTPVRGDGAPGKSESVAAQAGPDLAKPRPRTRSDQDSDVAQAAQAALVAGYLGLAEETAAKPVGAPQGGVHAEPVKVDAGWLKAREAAKPVRYRAERFDPASSGGKADGLLDGKITQIRFDVRRFQPVPGVWVRELAAPVDLTSSTAGLDMKARQDWLSGQQKLLDDHFNGVYRFANGDLAHFVLDGNTPAEVKKGWDIDPGRSVPVKMFDSSVDGARRVNQLEWDTRDRAGALHELFHFFGLGEAYRDGELLFKRPDQDGIMGPDRQLRLNDRNVAKLDELSLSAGDRPTGYRPVLPPDSALGTDGPVGAHGPSNAPPPRPRPDDPSRPPGSSSSQAGAGLHRARPLPGSGVPSGPAIKPAAAALAQKAQVDRPVVKDTPDFSEVRASIVDQLVTYGEKRETAAAWVASSFTDERLARLDVTLEGDRGTFNGAEIEIQAAGIGPAVNAYDGIADRDIHHERKASVSESAAVAQRESVDPTSLLNAPVGPVNVGVRIKGIGTTSRHRASVSQEDRLAVDFGELDRAVTTSDHMVAHHITVRPKQGHLQRTRSADTRAVDVPMTLEWAKHEGGAAGTHRQMVSIEYPEFDSHTTPAERAREFAKFEKERRAIKGVEFAGVSKIFSEVRASLSFEGADPEVARFHEWLNQLGPEHGIELATGGLARETFHFAHLKAPTTIVIGRAKMPEHLKPVVPEETFVDMADKQISHHRAASESHSLGAGGIREWGGEVSVGVGEAIADTLGVKLTATASYGRTAEDYAEHIGLLQVELNEKTSGVFENHDIHFRFAVAMLEPNTSAHGDGRPHRFAFLHRHDKPMGQLVVDGAARLSMSNEFAMDSDSEGSAPSAVATPTRSNSAGLAPEAVPAQVRGQWHLGERTVADIVGRVIHKLVSEEQVLDSDAGSLKTRMTAFLRDNAKGVLDGGDGVRFPMPDGEKDLFFTGKVDGEQGWHHKVAPWKELSGKTVASNTVKIDNTRRRSKSLAISVEGEAGVATLSGRAAPSRTKERGGSFSQTVREEHVWSGGAGPSHLFHFPVEIEVRTGTDWHDLDEPMIWREADGAVPTAGIPGRLEIAVPTMPGRPAKVDPAPVSQATEWTSAGSGLSPAMRPATLPAEFDLDSFAPIPKLGSTISAMLAPPEARGIRDHVKSAAKWVMLGDEPDPLGGAASDGPGSAAQSREALEKWVGGHNRQARLGLAAGPSDELHLRSYNDGDFTGMTARDTVGSARLTSTYGNARILRVDERHAFSSTQLTETESTTHEKRVYGFDANFTASLPLGTDMLPGEAETSAGYERGRGRDELAKVETTTTQTRVERGYLVEFDARHRVDTKVHMNWTGPFGGSHDRPAVAKVREIFSPRAVAMWVPASDLPRLGELSRHDLDNNLHPEDLAAYQATTAKNAGSPLAAAGRPATAVSAAAPLPELARGLGTFEPARLDMVTELTQGLRAALRSWERTVDGRVVREFRGLHDVLVEGFGTRLVLGGFSAALSDMLNGGLPVLGERLGESGKLQQLAVVSARLVGGVSRGVDREFGLVSSSTSTVVRDVGRRSGWKSGFSLKVTPDLPIPEFFGSGLLGLGELLDPHAGGERAGRRAGQQVPVRRETTSFGFSGAAERHEFGLEVTVELKPWARSGAYLKHIPLLRKGAVKESYTAEPFTVQSAVRSTQSETPPPARALPRPVSGSLREFWQASHVEQRVPDNAVVHAAPFEAPKLQAKLAEVAGGLNSGRAYALLVGTRAGQLSEHFSGLLSGGHVVEVGGRDLSGVRVEADLGAREVVREVSGGVLGKSVTVPSDVLLGKLEGGVLRGARESEAKFAAGVFGGNAALFLGEELVERESASKGVEPEAPLTRTVEVKSDRVFLVRAELVPTLTLLGKGGAAGESFVLGSDGDVFLRVDEAGLGVLGIDVPAVIPTTSTEKARPIAAGVVLGGVPASVDRAAGFLPKEDGVFAAVLGESARPTAAQFEAGLWAGGWNGSDPVRVFTCAVNDLSAYVKTISEALGVDVYRPADLLWLGFGGPGPAARVGPLALDGDGRPMVPHEPAPSVDAAGSGWIKHTPDGTRRLARYRVAAEASAPPNLGLPRPVHLGPGDDSLSALSRARPLPSSPGPAVHPAMAELALRAKVDRPTVKDRPDFSTVRASVVDQLEAAGEKRPAAENWVTSTFTDERLGKLEVTLEGDRASFNGAEIEIQLVGIGAPKNTLDGVADRSAQYEGATLTKESSVEATREGANPTKLLNVPAGPVTIGANLERVGTSSTRKSSVSAEDRHTVDVSEQQRPVTTSDHALAHEIKVLPKPGHVIHRNRPVEAQLVMVDAKLEWPNHEGGGGGTHRRNVSIEYPQADPHATADQRAKAFAAFERERKAVKDVTFAGLGPIFHELRSRLNVKPDDPALNQLHEWLNTLGPEHGTAMVTGGLARKTFQFAHVNSPTEIVIGRANLPDHLRPAVPQDTFVDVAKKTIGHKQSSSGSHSVMRGGTQAWGGEVSVSAGNAIAAALGVKLSVVAGYNRESVDTATDIRQWQAELNEKTKGEFEEHDIHFRYAVSMLKPNTSAAGDGKRHHFAFLHRHDTPIATFTTDGAARLSMAHADEMDADSEGINSGTTTPRPRSNPTGIAVPDVLRHAHSRWRVSENSVANIVSRVVHRLAAEGVLHDTEAGSLQRRLTEFIGGNAKAILAGSDGARFSLPGVDKDLFFTGAVREGGGRYWKAAPWREISEKVVAGDLRKAEATRSHKKKLAVEVEGKAGIAELKGKLEPSRTKEKGDGIEEAVAVEHEWSGGGIIHLFHYGAGVQVRLGTDWQHLDEPMTWREEGTSTPEPDIEVRLEIDVPERPGTDVVPDPAPISPETGWGIAGKDLPSMRQAKLPAVFNLDSMAPVRNLESTTGEMLSLVASDGKRVRMVSAAKHLALGERPTELGKAAKDSAEKSESRDALEEWASDRSRKAGLELAAGPADELKLESYNEGNLVGMAARDTVGSAKLTSTYGNARILRVDEQHTFSQTHSNTASMSVHDKKVYGAEGTFGASTALGTDVLKGGVESSAGYERGRGRDEISTVETKTTHSRVERGYLVEFDAVHRVDTRVHTNWTGPFGGSHDRPVVAKVREKFSPRAVAMWVPASDLPGLGELSQHDLDNNLHPHDLTAYRDGAAKPGVPSSAVVVGLGVFEPVRLEMVAELARGLRAALRSWELSVDGKVAREFRVLHDELAESFGSSLALGGFPSGLGDMLNGGLPVLRQRMGESGKLQQLAVVSARLVGGVSRGVDREFGLVSSSTSTVVRDVGRRSEWKSGFSLKATPELPIPKFTGSGFLGLGELLDPHVGGERAGRRAGQQVPVRRETTSFGFSGAAERYEFGLEVTVELKPWARSGAYLKHIPLLRKGAVKESYTAEPFTVQSAVRSTQPDVSAAGVLSKPVLGSLREFWQASNVEQKVPDDAIVRAVPFEAPKLRAKLAEVAGGLNSGRAYALLVGTRAGQLSEHFSGLLSGGHVVEVGGRDLSGVRVEADLGAREVVREVSGGVLGKSVTVPSDVLLGKLEGGVLRGARESEAKFAAGVFGGNAALFLGEELVERESASKGVEPEAPLTRTVEVKSDRVFLVRAELVPTLTLLGKGGAAGESFVLGPDGDVFLHADEAGLAVLGLDAPATAAAPAPLHLPAPGSSAAGVTRSVGDSVETIRAGVLLGSSVDPALARAARYLPAEQGVFAAVLGEPAGSPSGRPAVAEFAAGLWAGGWNGSDPVRVFTCAVDDLAGYADDLVDELGVDVYRPADLLWLGFADLGPVARVGPLALDGDARPILPHRPADSLDTSGTGWVKHGSGGEERPARYRVGPRHETPLRLGLPGPVHLGPGSGSAVGRLVDEVAGTVVADPVVPHPLLGPDLFGFLAGVERPSFLQVDPGELATDQLPALLDALDLTHGEPGVITAGSLERRPDQVLVVELTPAQRAGWAPGDVPLLPARLEMPKLMHTIWLGGPVVSEGKTALVQRNIAAAAAKHRDPATGERSGKLVMWTDIPRAEFDQARKSFPSVDGSFDRYAGVREMLTGARESGALVVNINEFFHRDNPMRLQAFFQGQLGVLSGRGWAAASDIARIELLRAVGGVYTDGDNRVLDPGMAYDVVFNPERWALLNVNSKVGNAAFVMTRRHPMADLMLEEMSAQYDKSQRELFGPGVERMNKEFFDIPQMRSRRHTLMMRAGPEILPMVFRKAGYRKLPIAPAIEVASAGSWMGPADAGRVPVGGARPTVELTGRVVQTLVRDLFNREGDLHLTAVADAVAGQEDPGLVLGAAVRFLAGRPELASLVRSVTYSRWERGVFHDVKLPSDLGDVLAVATVGEVGLLGEAVRPAGMLSGGLPYPVELVVDAEAGGLTSSSRAELRSLTALAGSFVPVYQAADVPAPAVRLVAGDEVVGLAAAEMQAYLDELAPTLSEHDAFGVPELRVADPGPGKPARAELVNTDGEDGRSAHDAGSPATAAEGAHQEGVRGPRTLPEYPGVDVVEVRIAEDGRAVHLEDGSKLGFGDFAKRFVQRVRGLGSTNKLVLLADGAAISPGPGVASLAAELSKESGADLLVPADGTFTTPGGQVRSGRTIQLPDGTLMPDFGRSEWVLFSNGLEIDRFTADDLGSAVNKTGLATREPPPQYKEQGKPGTT